MDYIQNRFVTLFNSNSITIDEETLTINNQMDTVKGILEFIAKRNTGEILDDYTSYLGKVSKTEDCRSEEEVLLDKSFNKVIFELFFRVHEIDCSINKIRGISNDLVKTSILKSDLVKLFN